MIIIKDQLDLDNVKQDKNIPNSVIHYIENYFTGFSSEVGEKSSRGISIEKYGVIVLLTKNDGDLHGLGYLPNIINSVPEEVKVVTIEINGLNVELIHGLFLTNNEFGIDIIALKDELTGEVGKKLITELDKS